MFIFKMKKTPFLVIHDTKSELIIWWFYAYNSVKKFLTDALNKNRYLKRLEGQQLRDMVECMYEKTYQKGEYVIKQGEAGNHLFVLAGKNPRGIKHWDAQILILCLVKICCTIRPHQKHVMGDADIRCHDSLHFSE